MLGQQRLGAMGLGRRSSGRAAAVAAVAVAALALAAPAVAGIGPTTRESLTGASGQQANGASFGASLSADGSLVAFQADATDLVPNDTNMVKDVFVRDRTNATTTRVSVASNGAQANQGGIMPAISGDGRYVAFSSQATNLDPGATSGFFEVYVRDLTTGNTSRVSRTPTGGEPDNGSGGDTISISRDGRYVAFGSSATNLTGGGGGSPGRGLYVYDTKADKTVLVSAGGGPEQPSISADGRYVAFSTFRALVPGDTNGVGDVYIRDRDADGNGIFDEAGAGKTSTTLVSVALDGTSAGNDNSTGSPLRGPLALSADGRQVAFASNASNLVADDTNSKTDVFVRDLRAGKTARVSVASDGSQGNDRSGGPFSGLALSADGRRVAFGSDASNLVAGDRNFTSDVFVHDRDADGNGTFDEAGAGKTTTTLESVSTDGTQGNDISGGEFSVGVSLTGDGTGLAFGSVATNLVAGDTNAVSDVFFRRLAPPTQSTLTVVKAGAGQGTVTSSPAGIDCGSSCAHAFDTGTLVRLTAAPAAGSSFAGFTGTGCAGAAATCTATVDESRSVTATFAVAETGGGGNPPPGGGGNPPPAGGGNPPPGGGGNPPPGGGGSPPPAGGGNPPPVPPAAAGLVPGLGVVRDTSAPIVSGFGLTNDPFVVGGSTPTFGRAAKKAKRHKKGTTFGYTLSKDATVKIVIAQTASGRRRGKRCVAPTRRLGKARRCTRIITKGTLTRTSHQGSNRVAFSGRIGSRKLAPGRYQATLTATDPAKNTSKPQTIAFTIVGR